MLISSYALFLKTMLFQISKFLCLLAFISGIFAFLLFFCMEIGKGNKHQADIELVKKFTFIALFLFGLSMLIPLITVSI